LKEILAQIGLEPERVEMFNMSAAMAGEFVEATEKMTAQVEALGPNPLRSAGGQRKAENKERET
jgi:F420-non-reducing hydrogenase iron-sulfur subunit